jgi:hypothetical protein
MSIQVTCSQRASRIHRGPGYYLMRLRQHVSDADAEARRAKLLVGEWSASRVAFLPIRQRSPRIGPE